MFHSKTICTIRNCDCEGSEISCKPLLGYSSYKSVEVSINREDLEWWVQCQHMGIANKTILATVSAALLSLAFNLTAYCK